MTMLVVGAVIVVALLAAFDARKSRDAKRRYPNSADGLIGGDAGSVWSDGSRNDGHGYHDPGHHGASAVLVMAVLDMMVLETAASAATADSRTQLSGADLTCTVEIVVPR